MNEILLKAFIFIGINFGSTVFWSIIYWKIVNAHLAKKRDGSDLPLKSTSTCTLNKNTQLHSNNQQMMSTIYQYIKSNLYIETMNHCYIDFNVINKHIYYVDIFLISFCNQFAQFQRFVPCCKLIRFVSSIQLIASITTNTFFVSYF